VEALRLLKLLEENHRELAKALANNTGSSPGRTKATISSDQGVENASAEDDNAADDKSEETSSQKGTTEKASQAGKAAGSSISTAVTSPTRRPPRRELASSIASNLATARGKPPQERERQKQQRALPSTAEVTTQHAGGSISGKRIPPSILQPASISDRNKPSHAAASGDTAPPAAPSVTSDAFNAFYSSFETIFSKLPASLAFAGLPLANQPQPEPEPRASRKPRHTTSARASNDPDLSTIFSAATLRAVREDAGQGFGAHESFYVVPERDGRSQRRYPRGDHDEEDDGDAGSDPEFVDAKESLANSLSSVPGSPRYSRASSNLASSRKITTKKPQQATLSAGGKTMEELELENNFLKKLIDSQAGRLQMWEASAQSQSMALAQSLRLTRPAAAAADQAKAPAEAERIRELEDMVNAERLQKESAEHRVEKLRKENDRLLGVLGKYRDKWEMLKESARQREKRKEEDKKNATATGTS
jgi:hypothetical protein